MTTDSEGSGGMTAEALRSELAAVVDSGGSALEFLLLKFQAKANDPTSDYFLPLLLSGLTNPVVFPVLTVRQWEFSLTGEDGTQFAQNICATTAPFLKVQIPASRTSFPDITLGESTKQPKGNLQIQGLIDATFGTPVVSGPDQNVVTASIQFGAWGPDKVPAKLQSGLPPAGSALVLGGTFTMNQACCIADTKNVCISGTQNTQTGWGTFAMTFQAKTSGGANNVTGSTVATVSVVSMQPPQVAVALQKIELDVADLSAMNAAIDVTSIPINQHRKEWNQQAEKAMNDPATKQNIINNINGVLGSTNNLTSIQTLLEEQMNAYLKSLFG
jgi:hypothetical protein